MIKDLRYGVYFQYIQYVSLPSTSSLRNQPLSYLLCLYFLLIFIISEVGVFVCFYSKVVILNNGCVLSSVQLFATPWIVVHQAPLFIEFSRQEYWRRLPCHPPRNLPYSEIESTSALTGRFFTTAPLGEPLNNDKDINNRHPDTKWCSQKFCT